jgi:multidrug resistance efflux pump
MKWFTFICFIGAAAAGLFGTGFVSFDQAAPSLGPLTDPVRAPRRIFAAGVVEGAQREVTLDFELAGRIRSIAVAEGQTVAKGEALAALDDALWQQKVCEAEAQLQLAQAERERLVNGARPESREVARAEAKLAYVKVQQAEADWKRTQALFEQKAIPEQQYDKARFTYEATVAEYKQAYARVVEIEAGARDDEVKMADAKIKLAESAVQQAQTMLGKTKLVAPSNGTVLRVDAEPGALAVLEHPEPVITMVDAQQLRVRAWVEELDALSLCVGQSASVIADGRPDLRYVGTITWVAPSMGSKTHLHQEPGEHVDVKVREVLISLQDPKDLVVGLPVEVFIEPVMPTDGQDALSPDSQDQGPGNTVRTGSELTPAAARLDHENRGSSTAQAPIVTSGVPTAESTK